jgi:hypothetical protein
VKNSSLTLKRRFIIESGNLLKAVESAIRAKDWEKATEVLGILDPSEQTQAYYAKLAWHFELEGNFDVCVYLYGCKKTKNYFSCGQKKNKFQCFLRIQKAEKAYVCANEPEKVVDMYDKAGRWVDAYNIAAEHFGFDGAKDLYLQRAKELEDGGRMKEAEEVSVSVFSALGYCVQS